MEIQLEKNKIYCMDCLKGISLMKEQNMLVDIIITSPPYNIGKNYHLYNDNMPREEYLDWMENVAKNCKDIMSDKSSFFLNVGGKPSDQWIPLDIAQRFRKHLNLQNTIHWVKSIALPKIDMGNYPHITDDISVGHYQPVNSKCYLSSCQEYIFHFTKNGYCDFDKLAVGVPYQDKQNVGRWRKNNGDIRDRGNTWFIPYETIRKSRDHPTMFPVKLPELCLKFHGINTVDLAMDPFMGLGTTAVACKKNNINFIGFEIDEEYYKKANNRLIEHFAQTVLL